MAAALLATAGAAFAGGLWAAKNAVRDKIRAEASSRGLSAEVGKVEIHWKHVAVHDVQVQDRTGRIKASIRRIDVSHEMELGLRLTDVLVSDATVDLQGSPEIKKPPPPGRKSEAPTAPLRAEKVRVEWENPAGPGSSLSALIKQAEAGSSPWAKAEIVVRTPSGDVEMTGARVTKGKKGIEIDAETLKASLRGMAGEKSGGEKKGREKSTPIRVRSKEAVLEVMGEQLRARKMEAEVVREDGDLVLAIDAEKLDVKDRVSLSHLHAKTMASPMSGRTLIQVIASANSVSTQQDKIANTSFLTKDIRVSGALETDFKTSADLRSGRIGIGEAEITISLHVDPGEAILKAEMQEINCQSALGSVPQQLVPKIVPGTVTEGDASWRLEINVDLPDRKKPDVRMWIKNGCRVKEVPEAVSVKRIRKPFEREVYTSDRSRKTVKSGPGTAGWTPLPAVSKFMPLAVQAMEDPGFPAHRGILVKALENSMEQNITAGRFVRGGSTVTMQLAKNLWLAREKTLSRKLQELVLTTYLEQHMSKGDIMEYYLNVVEFGPDLYGIGPASEHFFKKPPASLSLSQSLFLASVLPRPNAAYFGGDGKLSKGRLKFLRIIMGQMLERGLILQHEYDRGIHEVPVFEEPGVGEAAVDGIVTEAGGIDPDDWQ